MLSINGEKFPKYNIGFKIKEHKKLSKKGIKKLRNI